MISVTFKIAINKSKFMRGTGFEPANTCVTVMSAQENAQVAQQMFAAPGQGDLMAALGMVAEDVDFRSPVPEPNRRGSRRSSRSVAVRRLPHFSKSFLRRCLERMEALEITAEGDQVVSEGRNRGTVRSTGRDYEHD